MEERTSKLQNVVNKEKDGRTYTETKNRFGRLRTINRRGIFPSKEHSCGNETNFRERMKKNCSQWKRLKRARWDRK